MTTTQPPTQTLQGHRSIPLGPSPFAATVPSIVAATLYAIASLTWGLAHGLPGGRWLSVHLFTLGVITNLVLVFSEHFTRTVTRSATEPARWLPAVANVGIPLLLVGMTTGMTWAVGAGATILTTAVFLSYRRLRAMRKQAVGARFAWIARMYERAHGAFIHGAVLGTLMGVGVLSGTWYGAARTAHLHVNILGWGGLTLLATLVFFGPTMVRTRIVAGADERAAEVLRYGATALTVGVLLLLATGVGGIPAATIRIVAAAAIGVFATAATITCWPVASAARRAKPSATRWPVVALSLWFPVAAWADVAVIASGVWRFLDAVGLAMFLGVLVQTIAVVLTYLAPMLRSRSFAGRDLMLARLEWGATARTVLFNLGVVAVVAGNLWSGGLAVLLGRAGWAAVVVTMAWLLIAVVTPLPRHSEESPAVSMVARRYRRTGGQTG